MRVRYAMLWLVVPCCAALFVGCEKREPVLVPSKLDSKPLPDFDGASGTAKTPSPFADSVFPAGGAGELPSGIQDPATQAAGSSKASDFESLSALSVGIAPLAGDLSFARLSPDENKKATLFQKELQAGLDDLNKGKFKESIEHFEVAEKADSRDFRPFFFEAVVQIQQDNIARGAAALDIAIQLAPEQIELYLHRGNLRLRTRDYGLAVDDFSRVIAAHPEHLAALMNRAAANFHRRRPKDVVADASTVIKAKSGIPDAHLLRALGYLMQGETTLARRDFDAAVASGLGKAAAESWGPLFRGRG